MADFIYYSSEDLREIEAQFRKFLFGQGFTLLVVDKSPIVRKTLSNDLRTAGYESIEEASKYQEALNLLPKCEGNIFLITDLDIPGADGIALIKTVLSTAPDSAAILIGDRTPKEKITQAVAAGARGFFPKPVDLAQLRGKLVELGAVPN